MGSARTLDLCGEVEQVVEVPRCWDGEIEQGRGILAPKGGYRVYAFSIAWGIKIKDGGGAGSVWGKADRVFVVMALCVG